MAIMVQNIFTTVPTFMIMFLAALQDISPSLYEAASIDGANGIQMFRKITLPMLRPIILLVVVLGTIGTLQVFDQVYLATKGGPLNTSSDAGVLDLPGGSGSKRTHSHGLRLSPGLHPGADHLRFHIYPAPVPGTWHGDVLGGVTWQLPLRNQLKLSYQPTSRAGQLLRKNDVCVCPADRIGIVMFSPFILAMLGTFKTDVEITAFPPKLLPATWLWQNWAKVWNTDLGQGGTFPRWLFNTAFLSVVISVSR